MDIVNWVNQSTIILSILVVLIIWGSFLYIGFRNLGFQTMFRSLTVFGLFFVWLFIIAIHNQLSSKSSLDSYKPIFHVGYIVFILTLLSLWRVVRLHIDGTLRHLFKKRNYRLLMIQPSRTVSFTSPSTVALPKQGNIIQSQSYGTIGSGIAITTTCFVSCALPAIYPILVTLFGSATAEPLSRLLQISQVIL
ncbi:hypothetical protein [Alkalihalobacillus deserti]|uniref:hypothetical protein n=1 Tax=Alkalihalobacillus deserti TaxID=2879466 RepID=UPI001D1496B1|nr:hypothetical protein [Alkalihalobacillus deserti]